MNYTVTKLFSID